MQLRRLAAPIAHHLSLEIEPTFDTAGPDTGTGTAAGEASTALSPCCCVAHHSAGGRVIWRHTVTCGAKRTHQRRLQAEAQRRLKAGLAAGQ